MARQRHLNNAPIVESIIDFRVRLPSAFDPQGFSSLVKDLSDKYPKSEPRRLISGSIQIKGGIPVIETPADKGIQGYWFKSGDEKEIAQFKADGFTFSRLHPYTKWELVLGEAKRLWELYRSKTSPVAINRIAARFINRLDIESQEIEIGDYLTAPPNLPETLPQNLSQFLIRLVIHENDLRANIMQTLAESPKIGPVGIILDIEVFKEGEGAIDEENIWPIFERIRELKNRIFFELITEKTASLFE